MVANKWNDAEAKENASNAGDDPADTALALQVYASRLIGSNKDLVLHGGGNTSCKVMRKDLFGTEIPVLHVKGSGHDLATIAPDGMPGLRLETVRELASLKALSDEDMVNVLRGAMLDASGPMPSVETLLHGWLPHNFINHSHATTMVALANQPDATEVIHELFGDRMGIVPFFMPGFDLGVAASRAYQENPEAEGLILLNHGHFAFADTPKEAYNRLIEHTNIVQDWLRQNCKQPTLRPKNAALEPAKVLPMLRSVLGAENAAFSGDPDAAMPVLDLRSSDRITDFLRRPDLEMLASRGVATPDHVIRTKRNPLVLDQASVSNKEAIKQKVSDYVSDYTEYFDRETTIDGGKIMLCPTPAVAWIDGLGIVGIGKDARSAAITADLAVQNTDATALAQDCNGHFPVTEQQLFEMEYWSLEQAKLGKSSPPAFSGKIVLITGGAGAIGFATAQAFVAMGACVFLVDISDEARQTALSGLGGIHGGIALDITATGAAEAAINACTRQFGGVDILVSNAGAAWSGEMIELDEKDLRKSFELNFFAHQALAVAAAKVFLAQGGGGQILFNVSKQAVNPGKGFGAYGLPKATTFFLLRQLALELGPKGIRVNGINADRIRSGLLDDGFITKRSKARGIDEETYMAGNLIRREVKAHHVADAFVSLALSERTTGHVMTVDGGNIEASLR